MAAPTPTVTAYFNLIGSNTLFVLDDDTKGELGNSTYLLAGDIATDISLYVRTVNIRRGRSRELDEISAGVAGVTVNNHTRIFDPEYSSGAFYGNIRPGKRITIAANGITIFDGKVDDWNFDYPVMRDSTASFDVADALAELAAKDFDAWTTTDAQLVGARLTAILDRNEVAYPSSRDLDTGTSILQGDNVSWGSNVLNYCQLVVKADLGMLFAAKNGVLTFYGRNRSVTGVGAPVFRDDGTGIPYSTVVVDFGTELLFNRVSVDATGFTKQTVSDSASIALYGVRTLSIANLPLDTEQQALDLANYLLNLYKAPTDRIASITIDLHRLDTADQTSVLNLDLGSVVRVIYTPNRIGAAIDKFCMVEGIDDTIAPAFHQRVLRLSNLTDGFSGQPFVLDDTEYGVLNTGVGVLAF